MKAHKNYTYLTEANKLPARRGSKTQTKFFAVYGRPELASIPEPAERLGRLVPR